MNTHFSIIYLFLFCYMIYSLSMGISIPQLKGQREKQPGKCSINCLAELAKSTWQVGFSWKNPLCYKGPYPLARSLTQGTGHSPRSGRSFIGSDLSGCGGSRNAAGVLAGSASVVGRVLQGPGSVPSDARASSGHFPAPFV